jgi:hypothetical protein
MQTGLVFVLGIAMLNGLFSPALRIVVLFAPVWYPACCRRRRASCSC